MALVAPSTGAPEGTAPGPSPVGSPSIDLDCR